MMKLPEGIDPNHVPLTLAAQLLGRSDLDKLARRLPIHTEGPPGKGVRRFTTWAAIQKFHRSEDRSVKGTREKDAPLIQRSKWRDLTDSPLTNAIAELQGELKCLPIVSCPCVYFLIWGNRIVYVGKTKNLNQRVVNHQIYGKSFTRVAYIEVDENRLNEVEAHWVRRLQPPYNNAMCEPSEFRRKSARRRKERIV